MAVRLTLACSHYDRTEGLRDGSVSVEGVDLTYVDLPVEEIFFRMATYQEFDVAELSLSTYVLGMGAGHGRFIAIPVFPSRAFRHSGIYVNSSAGISEPKQLMGRTVGIAEYQLTANVWLRGILQDEYDVPAASPRYRTGGLHAPGRIEKVKVDLPPGVVVEPIGPTQTLAEMLVSGEIDALYTPRTPRPFAERRPEVRRLFEDSGAEERRYYASTGVFPIMHVLVLRRDVYEENRWLARSLFKAFETARRQVMDVIEDTVAMRYMLPWLHDEVARTRALLGDDYWPYGLEANERTLRVFLRYAHEQGIVPRRLEPAELFAPESLESFVI